MIIIKEYLNVLKLCDVSEKLWSWIKDVKSVYNNFYLFSHQRKWAHHEKRAHHVQLCFLKGNNFGGCPSLTPRFALLTQNQESYNTKHSIYLESMLMQCYGNYICKIAFVVLWLSTYFALFFKWGRMSITDAPNLTIPQKSICQIQNISLAKL